MRDMKQQVALVTGSNRGIGFEIAKQLAMKKIKVILTSRDSANGEAAVRKIARDGVEKVVAMKLDVSNQVSVDNLLDKVEKTFGRLDILVNNAGQGQYGEFSETNIYRELSIIQLNISSLVVLTKLFLQDMIKKGKGRILNLSSVASKAPGPLNSVYHGTKAFVQSFTQAIATEVKDQGITITALLPGATDTDFFNKADMQQSKVVKDGKLEEAKTVAKEGYDALMRGDQMVVSGGLKNKMKIAMSNVLSDKAAAKKMHKESAPAEEGE